MGDIPSLICGTRNARGKKQRFPFIVDSSANLIVIINADKWEIISSLAMCDRFRDEKIPGQFLRDSIVRTHEN